MREKTGRKALAACLALLLMSGNMPVKPVAELFSDMAITASAEGETTSGTCGENLTWTLDAEGTLTISGTGDMYNFERKGAPWYNNQNIKTVMIENGVTSIGDRAFDCCFNIESVTIPDGITYIGDLAFLATNITSIRIPDGVTYIGRSAFYECEKLESITIPDSVTSSIGDSAFLQCISLTSVTIGNGVTAIDNSAFSSCRSLTSITIGNSVTTIGEWAFNHCSSLTNITLPDSLTSIGKDAFYDCSSLESITIPDNVISIGDSAFENCSSLTSSITIPDGITSIEKETFYGCSGIPEITIPDSVSSIGEGAFAGCTNLKIILPDGITSVSKGAFSGCTNLEITLPLIENLKEIGLSSCDNVIIHIAEGTESIPDRTFSGLKTITGITIPDSVTSIGEYAFSGCTALQSITIPDSVTSIGDFAFNSCTALQNATIGNGVTSIGNSAFENCESLTSVVIPDSLTVIPTCVFCFCTSLTNVTIPDSVTFIDTRAFWKCYSLTEITIPDSVTGTGYDLFMNCNTLKDIYCYAAPADLTMDHNNETGKGAVVFHIPAEYYDDYVEKFTGTLNCTFEAEAMGKCGEHATWFFDDETGKLTISGKGAMYDYTPSDLPWAEHNTEITSVEIKSGITSIGDFAFYSCENMPVIEIPDSVTSIGNEAFRCCIGLTSIEIPVSVSSIGSNAFYGCKGITDIYCYADPAHLIWNEYECDDFIYDEDNAPDVHYTTICHVPVDYLETYKKEFGADSERPVNVRFKADTMGKCGDYATWFFDSKSGKLTISGKGDMWDYDADNQQWSEHKSSITAVEIGSGITYIGKDAFYGCTGITDVHCYADPAHLIWNEYECDDFKTDKETVCHVPAEQYDTYVSKFGESVNVTFKSMNPFGKCGYDAYWEFDLDTGKLTISGIGAMWDYTNIDYYKPTWYKYKNDITSVEIEDGITSIGARAFYGCTSLESITIPNSVTSINYGSFEDCTSLESITIPNSVTSIGSDAFYRCTSLKSIIIPAGVTSIGAFGNCTSLESITLSDGVTSINDCAFYCCTGLKSITIPASVTSIGRDSFKDCNSITDVYCFADPEILTWDELRCDDFQANKATKCNVPPEYYNKYVEKFGGSVNVTFKANPMGKCGENVYWSFDSETGKLMISGTGAMSDYADKPKPWYQYENNITSVKIENGVTSIGDFAFYSYVNMTTIEIPDTVTSIGNHAFSGCKGLTLIMLPKSVTRIGYDAFYGCKGVKDVYCNADPASLIWNDENCDDFIHDYTNAPDVHYTTVCHVPPEYYNKYVEKFGESVNVTFNAALKGKCGDKAYWRFDTETGKLTIFGTGAIYDYEPYTQTWYDYRSNITSVEIDGGITCIGARAFYGCTGPESITIPNTVTSIGSNAFYGCTNVIDVYCYADPEKLTWNDDGFDDFKESGSTVCHVPMEYFVDYMGNFSPGCWTPVNVIFKTENPSGECGENVTWVLDLETGKLTISGTGNMFPLSNPILSAPWYDYHYYISSVEIENGITSIGQNAFYYCNLTSIKIPDSVTSIRSRAFLDCRSLESITIPNSVTSIEGHAFLGCTSLKSITLSDGITSIGSLAFDDCTGLTSITIPASVTSIGSDAFNGCSGITDVYCFADPEILTWNEYECNDFKTDKETVCHVPPEYYNKYVEKFGGSVNVTFKANPMGKCGDKACWSFDSETGKLTIFGEGTMCDFTPSDQPWAEHNTEITSVEIKSGITSIGNFAFYFCGSMTTIEIPDTVTSIGYDAFQCCISLSSIKIPDSVTRIGYDAFYGCKGVKDVYCNADPASLIWNDENCDDFIYDYTNEPDVHYTTVCHVPSEYLGKYAEKFGESVNVTFSGDMGLGEHLYGHSITLDGSIGVNFYVELTEELLESETAEMIFTVPNGSKTDTQAFLVKDVIADDNNKVVIGSKTYYKFRCSISAKDMASTITAQLVDGEKSGTKYTYSVKDYAEYILEHNEVEEYANAAPLVKAMLNYGAASQTYFGIEGTAANAGLDDADKALGEVSIPDTFKFDEANADLPEGVTFEGATLSLKSETTLSLYFKGLPEGTAFTCDGRTVETAKNGKYVVARIRGIKANELENDFTVTFEGDSVTYNVTYNAITYCYNVLDDGTDDENLKNVAKALYKYAEAARTYSE